MRTANADANSDADADRHPHCACGLLRRERMRTAEADAVQDPHCGCGPRTPDGDGGWGCVLRTRMQIAGANEDAECGWVQRNRRRTADWDADAEGMRIEIRLVDADPVGGFGGGQRIRMRIVTLIADPDC